MTDKQTILRCRALLVLLAAGTSQWLLWHTGARAVARAADTVSGPVRRSDTSQTAQLVADVAMGLVLVAGTWLVVATVVTVLAETATPSVRRWCPQLAPHTWRRLVINLLGTGMLAMPVVVTGNANALDGRSLSGDRGPGPEGTSLSVLDGLPYPDRPTTSTAGPFEPPPPARPRVVVRHGDSLWSLAAAADPGASDAQVARRWPHWYAINAEAIGPDPDLLIPGTSLKPPRHP